MCALTRGPGVAAVAAALGVAAASGAASRASGVPAARGVPLPARGVPAAVGVPADPPPADGVLDPSAAMWARGDTMQAMNRREAMGGGWLVIGFLQLCLVGSAQGNTGGLVSAYCSMLGGLCSDGWWVTV